MITRRWTYRSVLGLVLSLSAGCDNGLDLGSTEATGAGASSTSNASSSSSNATGSGMATGTGGASSGTTATGTGGLETTSSGSTGTGMCQDTCTPNAEQCSGAQVQQCKTQADGCYGWSAPASCPVNETCLGTQCVLACADQCTNGAKQCSGGKTQTCAKQATGCTDWGASQDCPAGQTCSGGTCVASCTDQCSAGAVQCSGPKTQTCAKQANGCTDWSAAQDCPAGDTCSGGQCVLACTNQCTAGAFQCVGADIQTCALQASGCTGWNSAQSCPTNQTCSGGQCVPSCTNACTVGASQCVGADIQTCALQASGCTGWSSAQSCPTNQTCSGGQCVPSCTNACTAGASQCMGAQIQTCALQASGCTGWSAAQSCPSGQSCSGGMCSTVTPVGLAAGGLHTCALTNSGGVKCWGRNFLGQLGNNSTTDSHVPIDVQGLSSSMTALAACGAHTCALTNSGGVKCWGVNSEGQLGNNSTTDSHVPIDVQGLSSSMTALAAGGFHTCALTSSGGVKCWGDNSYGQLGNNSTTESHVPVAVQGLSSGSMTALALGAAHTCALTSSGGVKCWGSNDFGALGDSSYVAFSTVPVTVQGLSSGVSALTAGGSQHTCAVMSSGGVKCWGYNSYGQLGDNSTTDSHVPVDVQGLSSGVTALVTNLDHTCALMSSGGVKCWGRNSEGQLGNNSTIDSLVPVDVQGLSSGVLVLTAGFDYTCALMSSGGIKCWGGNAYGQLGNNSPVTRSILPVDTVWP